MSYEIKMLDTARRDLLEVFDTLSAYSKEFTEKTISSILESIEHLKDHPLMYEAYRKDKRYRRIPVADYVVFYRVMERSRQVEIMRIIYGRRNYNKNRI